ncbi:hypothetical protein QEZ54_14815 [Catellatospora sp. KI3]|uniref:hypothetical protein n=1 Tax=Catellatospora sp. KI3 TaxID=3041620 RepID=UPI002482CD5F|nr:hypothetical protein [Catellatospora sp. KI3]MDI1462239.1 hypothetical protein [Catellatospora sp. KI3]
MELAGPLIAVALIVPVLAFWLWMFRDMLGNHRLFGQARNLWLLGFVFLNVFAAGLYYVSEYRDRP